MPAPKPGADLSTALQSIVPSTGVGQGQDEVPLALFPSLSDEWWPYDHPDPRFFDQIWAALLRLFGMCC